MLLGFGNNTASGRVTMGHLLLADARTECSHDVLNISHVRAGVSDIMAVVIISANLASESDLCELWKLL